MPPAAGALPRTPLKNLLEEVLKNLQNFLFPLRGSRADVPIRFSTPTSADAAPFH
jgi:hypothetical protein